MRSEKVEECRVAWRTMSLRGKRVLVKCDDAGQLRPGGDGRVEIRYNPRDGKAYYASVKNLKPTGDTQAFEDGYCGDAETARRSDTPKKGATKKSATKKSATKKSVKIPSAPVGNEVLAFCDGACSGNPGPAGLGAVMLWDDQRREISEYLGTATNNIAELRAIQRVVEGVPDRKRPLRIFTDSTYSIGVLTKGWKAKANVEIIAEIKKALAKHPDVTLIHVKGHAGIELNEVADQLAVRAVEDRQSTGWVAP